MAPTVNDEIGRAIVAGIGVLTILVLAPIAAMQVVECVRRSRQPDGLQTYRLATVALVSALLEIMAWRLLIWLDVVLWSGALLGPTMARWRLDMGIGGTILMLCVFVSGVFWKDRLGLWKRGMHQRMTRVHNGDTE